MVDGQLAGCGLGFSTDFVRWRRDPALLDPARDAAEIRAFFIDPAHSRKGLGATLGPDTTIEFVPMRKRIAGAVT